MNKIQREQWAQALESGNWKQHRLTMTNATSNSKATKHCCLAVAVELLDPTRLEIGGLLGIFKSDDIVRYVKCNDVDLLNFNQIAAIVRADDELLDTP